MKVHSIKFFDSVFLTIANIFLYVRFFFLVCRFRKKVGYFPNIAMPSLYHEKMLWRKIFDCNPIFIIFCDKLATKDYVNSVCPSLTVPKTLWVASDAEDVANYSLTEEMMIKANHGSNLNYAAKGVSIDIHYFKRMIRKWLKKNHGRKNLEWGYSKVKKKVFAEELILTNQPPGLIDINIRCADGKALMGPLILNAKTNQEKSGYFI